MTHTVVWDEHITKSLLKGVTQRWEQSYKWSTKRFEVYQQIKLAMSFSVKLPWQNESKVSNGQVKIGKSKDNYEYFLETIQQQDK